MNRDYLISKIAEQLKGKLIVRGYIWEIEAQIRCSMKDCFDNVDFKDISVQKDKHSNYFAIRYKDYYLFGLRYTKEQGDSHWKTFENYTDYYYKDFMCSDQEANFEIETRMIEIESRIALTNHYQKNLFKEMVENYKKIVALFGDKTNNILSYIQAHKYTIEKEVESNETNI